jgi:cell division protein FtsN
MPPGNGTTGQPMALPGKPGDPIPGKALPVLRHSAGQGRCRSGQGSQARGQKEEPKKEEKKEGREEKEGEAKKEEPKESKTPLFLQAGSFSTAQDADNQKAKLAFMGVEAVVQQVMIQDKTLLPGSGRPLLEN